MKWFTQDSSRTKGYGLPLFEQESLGRMKAESHLDILMNENTLIVVNFKTYESAHGNNATQLATAMKEVGEETGAAFVAATSPFDLHVVHNTNPALTVWAQHLDPIGFGSNTGRLHPATAVERGARGTLLNHAERQIPFEQIADTIEALSDGFTTCVCAADIEQAKKIATLGPDFIAVEPPELIGGDISVTSADPEIVRGTVEAVKQVNPEVSVLCGAGVKNGADVAKAIELGAKGVLLASGVTQSSDVYATLKDLVSQI